MSMPGPAGSGGLVVDVEQRLTVIQGVDGSAHGFESYQLLLTSPMRPCHLLLALLPYRLQLCEVRGHSRAASLQLPSTLVVVAMALLEDIARCGLHT